MKKEYLLVVSPFLVISLAWGLFEREQEILAAFVVVIYLAFIFGFDKFKFDLKNKKIEVEDKKE